MPRFFTKKIACLLLTPADWTDDATDAVRMPDGGHLPAGYKVSLEQLFSEAGPGLPDGSTQKYQSAVALATRSHSKHGRFSAGKPTTTPVQQPAVQSEAQTG